MERKLPVLATLIAAVDLCREHLSYALKILAPWFIVFLITPYLFLFVSIENPAEEGVTAIELWDTLSAFLYVIAWGSIAVLWHWRVLRDDSYGQKAVIFDSRVWYYVLRGILISIIVGGVAFLMAFPAMFVLSTLGSNASDVIVLFTVAGCLLIIVGILFTRLSIALPAIALNVPDFGLRDAWKATAGTSLRLFLVTALPLLPIYLLSGGMIAIGVDVPNFYQLDLLWFLAYLAFQIAGFAFGVLGLTVLSLTYAFFVESRGKDAPEAAGSPPTPS